MQGHRAQLKTIMRATAAATVMLLMLSPVTSATMQRLHFPQDYSLGSLSLLVPAGDDNNFDSFIVVKALGPAQHTISIPAGKYAGLEGSAMLFRHSEALEKLEPNDLARLVLRFSSLADDEDRLLEQTMTRVGHLTGLQELNVTKSDISDRSLATINKLSNLRRLEANLTALDGSFMKELKALKSLRTLRLNETALSEKNLQYLVNFPQLRFLSLQHCRIGEKGLNYIKVCSKLANLELDGNSQINDENIKQLAALKNLTYLSIRQTPITISGLKKISPASRLRQITLPRPHYSRSELAAIQKLFPTATLSVVPNSQLDAENQTIFAPLH